MQGVDRYQANGIEVLRIEDGKFVFHPEEFPDLSANDRAARLSAAGQSQIDTVFSAYVLRHTDGRVDLVDTGCGGLMGADAGLLADRLAGLGVAPESVSRVILTHLHGDHCGGAVLRGQLTFRNARYVLQAAEVRCYTGLETPGGHLLRLADGLIDEIDGAADLGDGLTAWPLPGHTPGHMGVRVGDELVLVGDLLHSAALQLPEPALSSVNDMDAEAAHVARVACLAEIAAQGLVWSGSHMVGRAFGRLQAQGGGYLWADV